MNRDSPRDAASFRDRTAASLRYVAALVVVALGAALFAVAFRWLLSFAFKATTHAADVVSMFEHLSPWGRLLLPAAGGLLAGSVALAAARARRDQGVGDVMEAVVFGRATTRSTARNCASAAWRGSSRSRGSDCSVRSRTKVASHARATKVGR